MTTWLLPLRAGDDNEECRYAIRSWVANARLVEGLDELVTVGHRPAWLQPDLHIDGNHHRSGPLNVYANVRDACLSGRLPERVIVANDDHFAMRPVDPEEIAYRCSLRDHLLRLRARKLGGGWWGQSLHLTLMMLRSAGISDPLSYELHRPLPVVTEDMARVLRDNWSGHGFPAQWRTLYANLCGIGGEQSDDHKVFNRATDNPDADWISTTDGTWRTSQIADRIRSTFTTPTAWENHQ